MGVGREGWCRRAEVWYENGYWASCVVGALRKAGLVATFTYDAVGRAVSPTDRLARRKDITYGDEGRPRKEKWYTSGGSWLDA